MNSAVAELRFFSNHTVDRPDLARRLIRLRYPRKLPVVLGLSDINACRKGPKGSAEDKRITSGEEI